MTGDELTCPKCQGSMRRYERNGIHIDQCSECRGVFLDRGELEHLIDAEAAFAQAAQESKAQPTQAGPSGWAQGQPPSYGYDQRRHGDHGHRGKRPKSFLSELFD